MSTTPDASAVIRPRAAVGVTAVVLAVAATQVLPAFGVVRDAGYLIVAVGVAVAGLVALVRSDEAQRSVRWPIAAALACSAAAALVLWGYDLVGRSVPSLSWSDPWRLLASGLLILGAAYVVAGRGGWRVALDLDVMIDVAAVLLLIGYVAWHFVVAEAATDMTVSLAGRILSAVYPAADLLAVVLLFRALAGRRRPPSALLLIAGAWCWLMVDAASTTAMQAGLGQVDDWTRTAWLTGAILVAASLWVPATDPLEAADTEETARLEPVQVGWTMLPLLLPMFLELVAHGGAHVGEAVSLLAVTAVLGALLTARSLRLVGARNQAHEQMARQRRYFRALAATSSDAVIVIDGERRIVHDAPLLGDLLGDRDLVATGRDVVEVIDPADADALVGLLGRSLMAPGEVLVAELDLASDIGRVSCLDVRIVNRLADPDVEGIVLSLHDATGRRVAAEELRRRAFLDSLTGLANRALFQDRLEQALRRSGRSSLDPAVIFLDLDGFKKVNDSMGHEVGDAVLVALGERIRRAVRPEDTVARLGGDEFAVLVEGSREPVADAIAAARRVLSALSAPVQVGGREWSLAASMGIDVGTPSVDASTVLRNADIAMYRAKAAGKGRWVVFDPTMRAVALERLELEIDLDVALEREEFRLLYQPVIDLGSDAVVGFEALIRWQHPTYGSMPPGASCRSPRTPGRSSPSAAGRWRRRVAPPPAGSRATPIAGPSPSA